MPPPTQNRRRRSTDSYTVSAITVLAHASISLLAILTFSVIVDAQLGWFSWAVMSVVFTLVHWAIKRVTSGRAFARLILPTRLRETLNTIPDGLLLTDDHDRIIMANDAFLQSIGMSQQDLVGRTARSLPWVCSNHSSQEEMPWIQAMRNNETLNEQLMRYQLTDGQLRFFAIKSCPMKTDDENSQGVLITLRDVTAVESRKAELEQKMVVLRSSRDAISTRNRELQVLADQDPLTGCLNRRSFFNQFKESWAESGANETSLACLMLDVDHFKQVNDLFGHQVGDDVLRAVSDVLNQHVKVPSLVGRYGGEEFCVMLIEQDLNQATQSAEEIREQIERAKFASQPGLCVTVSIGVSVKHDGVKTLEDLIRQADECLYFAKENGRNRVINRQLFVSSAEERAPQLAPIESNSAIA